MSARPPGATARRSGRPARAGPASVRPRQMVLGLMVGIPTLIQLVLVWIPTLHLGRPLASPGGTG